jgi:membrane protease YdiL (CAAX protease family)
MTVVVFFLAYMSGLAWISTRRIWRRARDPDAPPAPRRLTNRQLLHFGGRQLLFTAVLVIAWTQGGWTPQSIGVPEKIDWIETILAGELGFLAVILANLAVVVLARKLGAMRLIAARGNLRLWPRGRAAKWLAALFIMVFNPFTEELVMRGILIHQWGDMLGSPALPIVAGFVLNGALHWYQGWRMQLWHAQYFAVAVILLYSPWGLPAAMVAHLFGDTLPILALGRTLRYVRKSRQRERGKVSA